MATTRKKPGLQKRRKAYQRNRPNAKLHYEGAVLISIPESMRVTGLGLSLTYKMVRDGTLPAAQVNGRWYIHRPKLMEWLNKIGGSESAA
jgi:excisionase family DNA binding protein